MFQIFIVIAFLAVSPNLVLAQAAGPLELAEEAAGLYRAAQHLVNAGEKGRLLFLVSKKFEELRTRYPGSSLAAQVALGRYRDIDIASVSRQGEDWRKAQPPGSLVGLPGNPPIPNFRGPETNRAPQLALPNFSRSSSVPEPILAPRRISRPEMIELLRDTVAIVYSRESGGSYSFGTAFFVSPRHLQTNAHVVAGHDRVIVANKTIGVRAASVLHRGMTSDGVGIDTAIMEIENYQSNKFLQFSNTFSEGDTIAIGGYPGTAMRQDAGAQRFFALLGDGRIPTIDSFPAVRFDFGTIQGIFKKQDTGIENIQTGVTSSQGNSGSPYINECGQVVAQEYSGSVQRLHVRNNVAIGMVVNFNWALSGRELVKFGQATRIPIAIATTVCR